MKAQSAVTILFLCFFLCISACTKKDEKSVQDQDSLQVHDHADSLADWIQELPQRPGYLYAAGSGRSRDPGIARKKAELEARTRLAEQLSDSLNADSLDQILVGAYLKDVRQEQSGDLWNVYVLIELDSLSGKF